MLRRFLSWDTPSKWAALLCPVAAHVPFLIGAAKGGSGEGEWWQWLFLPLAIIFCVPFVGAPQLAMLVLIRWSDEPFLKIIFLAASTLLVGVLGWFFATADLSSTSTAPLAMLFFPLYVGAASLTVGAILLCVVKVATRLR